MGYLNFDRRGSFLSAETDFLCRFLRQVDLTAAERSSAIGDGHVSAPACLKVGYLDLRPKRKLVGRRSVAALMERGAAGGFMTVQAVRVIARLAGEALSRFHIGG